MLIFRDIAMVLTSALLAGLLFWRLRQPLILGYVLAGLVLSPLTPGPRVHEVHTFETMAEVGVILLMFSIGVEFSIPGMLRVKWVALIGAPIGISLSIALGVAAGSLLGWPLLQGVALGCIVCVASTMVLSGPCSSRHCTAASHEFRWCLWESLSLRDRPDEAVER